MRARAPNLDARAFPFVPRAPASPVFPAQSRLSVGSALISINNSCRKLDFGAFHAGVELDGVEYSFGRCEEGSGVYSCTPCESPGYHYRQTVEMGETSKSRPEINMLLCRMVLAWTGARAAVPGSPCADAQRSLAARPRDARARVARRLRHVVSRVHP